MSEDSFPHIRFEYHAVEDRAETMKNGHFVQKDVLYAFITRPGQRDTLVKDAKEYSGNLKEAVRQGRIPPSWPQAYDSLLKAFLDGNELPTHGTPILGWPVMPPSAQKMLIQAGVKTVEELAEIPEADMVNIGMGAISYRQKARAWLEAAETGKSAEVITNLNIKLEEATRLIQQQAEALQKLSAPAKA